VGRAIKAVESAPEPVKGTLREAETVTRKTRGGTIEIPTRVLWVPEDECARDEPLLSVWEHPRGGEQIDVDDDMDLRLLPPAARRGGEAAAGGGVARGAREAGRASTSSRRTSRRARATRSRPATSTPCTCWIT
jgi:hypothetical protein